MQFYTVVALMAASAMASPQVKRYPSIDQITVEQANNACGNNMEVTCCNTVKNEATGNAVGNGPELLNDLNLFGQCSKLQVDVLAIANNLLQKECGAHAACCQNSPSTASGGLVNLALPCVALAGLL
ncbi:hypothetical protein ACLX1H_004537 [Fusarium chlamydosporum]